MKDVLAISIVQWDTRFHVVAHTPEQKFSAYCPDYGSALESLMRELRLEKSRFDRGEIKRTLRAEENKDKKE